MRDPATPREVVVTSSAPEPFWDPTLGVEVAPRAFSAELPRHRLVTVGDSLVHGMQSAAVYRTELSCPAIVAHELGLELGSSFRFARYGGPGGLPLNIELLVRELERQFGTRIDWWELALAAFRVRGWLDEVEDYWERGPGSGLLPVARINHNLGVYGWDLRNALELTAARVAARIGTPKDDPVAQGVERANERAAFRVLASVEGGMDLTPFGAARALGRDVGDGSDPDHGIETLVVALGANNALETVVDLKVAWSADPAYKDLARKGAFTVWRPSHFAKELALVAAEVRGIAARHVIWGTVPHVTIAPVARGVSQKVRPASRYYPYYTRPWIGDRDFDPRDDPHITEQQARAVDSAVDMYNDAIAKVVADARADGLDWRLLDLAGLLDRLASRRYLESPASLPDWWLPYRLPAELAALQPPPDSRFFSSNASGRQAGGLFSLDGVHPTTVGYGILAQEIMDVVSAAGVEFHHRDGRTRAGPVRVDFARLIALDTLISDPPRSTDSSLKLIGWIDQHLGFLGRLIA